MFLNMDCLNKNNILDLCSFYLLRYFILGEYYNNENFFEVDVYKKDIICLF